MKTPGKHKLARAPKLHTMEHQITFTFIGLFLLSVLAITLINGIFLEKYYVSRKKEVLLEAKEVLAQIDVDEVVHDDGTEEELPSQIATSGSRNNLTWVLINSDNTKQHPWLENEDQLRNKLFFGYASNLDDDKVKSRI